ncbi:MAG TPA: YbaB/EbfC family nucleoid-associated protein [Planctomycetaceae bacterium]|jgi:DNA-binding YbaB/EbfC family protein|nr:YbaB/EbfC family nucleoid-associated protein [Planctomycetaceae bacterium]
MFKELGQLAGMMKQLQGLSGRMQEMKDRLAAKRVTGTGGDGLVRIEMDGTSKTLGCNISPELLASGDQYRLQSLIVDAVNDAQEKVRLVAAEEMKDIMGVDGMPGFMKMLGGMG